MALTVLLEELAGFAACFDVNRHADQGLKQIGDYTMFFGPRAVP